MDTTWNQHFWFFWFIASGDVTLPSEALSTWGSLLFLNVRNSDAKLVPMSPLCLQLQADNLHDCIYIQGCRTRLTASVSGHSHMISQLPLFFRYPVNVKEHSLYLVIKTSLITGLHCWLYWSRACSLLCCQSAVFKQKKSLKCINGVQQTEQWPWDRTTVRFQYLLAEQTLR